MPQNEHHSTVYHRWFRALHYPDDMHAVTSIDHNEVRPQEAGLSAKSIQRVWALTKDFYRTGMHPGVALCVRHRGKIVINRALGYASGLLPDEPGDPKPLQLETPICLFSASKAITAMVAHLLAEEGHVNLLDPVAYYLPEFASKGKGHITILQLLSHRGGVPLLQGDYPPEALTDTEQMLRAICEIDPSCTEGRRTEYHAVTGGFIIEELVRVTTGQSIRDYLDQKICQPMGMRYFNYGLAPEDLDCAAQNYVTGLTPGKTIDRLLGKVLGTVPDAATPLTNDVRFKQAIIPSANLYATAEETCRFFQMMIDNGSWQGRQIMDPMTVFHATRESGTAGFDQLIRLPVRYSSGMMLGGKPVGMYGVNTHYAFGHVGYSNVFCWGDPERDLAVALMTTGKPILGPHVPLLPKLLFAISKISEPVRDFRSRDLLYREARYQHTAA